MATRNARLVLTLVCNLYIETKEYNHLCSPENFESYFTVIALIECPVALLFVCNNFLHLIIIIFYFIFLTFFCGSHVCAFSFLLCSFF